MPGRLPGGANVLLAPCFAAAASLVLRFRRARGRERLQMKWFASAAALIALLFAVAPIAAVTKTGRTPATVDTMPEKPNDVRNALSALANIPRRGQTAAWSFAGDKSMSERGSARLAWALLAPAVALFAARSSLRALTAAGPSCG